MKYGPDGVELAGFIRDGVLRARPQKFDSNYTTVPALHSTYIGQVIGSDQCSIVDDPILGAARKVLRMDVPNTPLADGKVRVQLCDAFAYGSGHDVWLGFATLFPADFPVVPANGFFTTAEFYGPPFNGTAPTAFHIYSDDRLHYGLRGSESMWKAPTALPRGSWIDLVLHVRFSSKARHGFAEIWMNTGAGWVQTTFVDGSKRCYYPTLSAANGDGFNASMIKHYRSAGMWPGTVTQFFAEHRIGSSFAEVVPHSYG